jgi:hypothetical protein
MNDHTPPLRNSLNACSPADGKSLAAGKTRATGYWWLGVILAPITGTALGTIIFLLLNRNNIGYYGGHSELVIVFLPMVGFFAGSLLSAIFLVISFIKKERHAGKAMLFLIICLLLNISLLFG